MHDAITGPAGVGHEDLLAGRVAWGAALAASIPLALVVPGLSLACGLIGALAAARLLGARFRRDAVPRDLPRGSVRTTAHGVVVEVGGRRFEIAREDVVDGRLEPQPWPTAVLRTRRRVVRVRVETFERAHAILDACGATAERRTTRLRIATPAERVPLLTTLLVLVAISATPVLVIGVAIAATTFAGKPLFPGAPVPWLATTLALAALVAIGRALRPTLVTIGRDAVVVDGLLGRRTIPLASIADVTARDDAVVLERRDGPPCVLRVRAEGHAPASHARDVILARLAEVRALESVTQVADRLHVLDRGHEAARGDRYREVGLEPADLVRIVGAPDAPRERRVAAARVLASSDDRAALDDARALVDALADDEVRSEVRAALDR